MLGSHRAKKPPKKSTPLRNQSARGPPQCNTPQRWNPRNVFPTTTYVVRQEQEDGANPRPARPPDFETGVSQHPLREISLNRDGGRSPVRPFTNLGRYHNGLPPDHDPLRKGTRGAGQTQAVEGAQTIERTGRYNPETDADDTADFAFQPAGRRQQRERYHGPAAHVVVPRHADEDMDQAPTWVHVQERPSPNHCGPRAHEGAPGSGAHALKCPDTSRNVPAAGFGGKGGSSRQEYGDAGDTDKWQVPHQRAVRTRVTDVLEAEVAAMHYWDEGRGEEGPLRDQDGGRLVTERHRAPSGEQYAEQPLQYGSGRDGPVSSGRRGVSRGYWGPEERYTMDAAADLPLAAATRREGAQEMPTPQRTARAGSARRGASFRDEDTGSNDENQPPPSSANYATLRAPATRRGEQPLGSSPGGNRGPTQRRHAQDGQYTTTEHTHSVAASSYHQSRTPSAAVRAARQQFSTPSRGHVADALDDGGPPGDFEDFREWGDAPDGLSRGREGGGAPPGWREQSMDAAEGRRPDFESLQKDLRRLEARVVAAEAQATRSARSGSTRTTPSRAQGSCPPTLSPELSNSPAPVAPAPPMAAALAKTRGIEETLGRNNAVAGMRASYNAFKREARPAPSGRQAPDDDRVQNDPSCGMRDLTHSPRTLHRDWGQDPSRADATEDWDPRPDGGRVMGRIDRGTVPSRGVRGEPGGWGRHGGAGEDPQSFREPRAPRERYPDGAEATSRRDHRKAERTLWEPQAVEDHVRDTWVDDVGRPMSPRTLEALLQKALRQQGLHRGTHGRPAEDGVPGKDGRERGGPTWHMEEVDLGLQALRASIFERERSHRQVALPFCALPLPPPFSLLLAQVVRMMLTCARHLYPAAWILILCPVYIPFISRCMSRSCVPFISRLMSRSCVTVSAGFPQSPSRYRRSAGSSSCLHCLENASLLPQTFQFLPATPRVSEGPWQFLNEPCGNKGTRQRDAVRRTRAE